ncbi:MAG: glycoside hydrolase family 127 protein [Clostridiales bacterium]|nr:glycoside hydrolase family 127 protein [Clostridiales bacterium]
MKYFKKLSVLCALIPCSAIVHAGSDRIEIGGFVGDRINTCIEKRVKAQDVSELVEPFRHSTEGGWWQSEFFGKWMLGAIASYRYTNDSQLLQQIKDAANEFMGTQHSDGYIGNYKPEKRLTNWDIWGRKYSTLSLISYYRLTGDKKALEAACGVIDHLIGELNDRGVDIGDTGFYQGMASCSVLEPVVYLYKETGNPRYLDFAKNIVKSIEKNGHSQLITKAMDCVPVNRRTSHPKDWWSYENGQKAYEMMSCYEGLVELGNVLGEPLYLEAAKKTAESIIGEEINIAGSGAAFECWYEGKRRQTLPAYHTMETCVSFTWMQFLSRLWSATHNPEYIDEFERTMYNALMASMKNDGSQISKYSPLEGRRVAGEEQCGMHINCCNANGPRGFALIPEMAYQVDGNRLYVNLVLPSKADVTIGKNTIALDMKTEYPLNGKAELSVTPRKEEDFTLSVRIPAWSGDGYMVAVNGEKQDYSHKGSYLSISRKWKKGDIVTIDFDLSARIQRHDNFQAISFGPVVFARDNRFDDGDVDECAVIECDETGKVPATISDTFGKSFAWLTMEVPMVLGSDLENPENKQAKMIKLCDFASSGNDWSPSSRYRVWIPETLHVMSGKYHKY